VPRPAGGFLVAFTRYDLLLVGEHREDGSREEVRRLGSLGYSGAWNLRSLQPIDDDAYVAAWDVDHHYAGFLSSQLVVEDGGERHRTQYLSKRGLAVLGDGRGGIMGFYGTTTGTFFARWNRDGRVQRTRRVLGTGQPLRALPFRGGVLLVSSRSIHGETRLEWFDGEGRRLEGARSERNTVATNGSDAIVDLRLSDNQRLVLGRFGASPVTLGGTRVLVEELGTDRLVEVVAAVRGDGVSLVAWSLWPQQSGCAVWARAFDRRGHAVSEAGCVADTGGGSPRLAARRDGGFWMAWSTTELVGSEFVDTVWLRTLELLPAAK
jgi:hypothetical protein